MKTWKKTKAPRKWGNRLGRGAIHDEKRIGCAMKSVRKEREEGKGRERKSEKENATKKDSGRQRKRLEKSEETRDRKI